MCDESRMHGSVGGSGVAAPQLSPSLLDIVDAAFLLAVSRAFARSHVEHEDLGRPSPARAKAAPRALTLRREGRHEAIQDMRKRQDTAEWRAFYGARAGIEGCLSQGIRLCGLRARATSAWLRPTCSTSRPLRP